ncbi:hypothetical protein Taro_014414 [Colocasia esculenta]|uniref:Uncharacterized protein n=1 Tax=Colocasia esculenta TaxID=4460 RepID=A0A843UEU6_COLES|nr:hypothetical protein [Colocasia esculenta]
MRLEGEFNQKTSVRTIFKLQNQCYMLLTYDGKYGASRSLAGFFCLGLEPNGSPLREMREDCRQCGRRSVKPKEDQGGPVEEPGEPSDA